MLKMSYKNMCMKPFLIDRQTVLSKLLAPCSCDLMPLDICLAVLSNAGCTKQRFTNYKITFRMQVTVTPGMLQVVRKTALLNDRY